MFLAQSEKRRARRLFDAPTQGAAILLGSLVLWAGAGTARAQSPSAAESQLWAEVESLRRSQNWAAVSDRLGRLVELNPTVARNWFELGLARCRARRFSEAISAFERAEQLGGGFTWDPVYTVGRGETLLHLAGCQAQLGHPDQALALVERSLAAGLRRPSRLLADAKLAPLRNDPRLRTLAGAIDPPATPAEGYQADLDFLTREMFRLHYNPFHRHPREAFDREIAEFRADLSDLSPERFLVRAQRLLCLLGDGHTSARLERCHVLPLGFYWFEEGMFVRVAQAGSEQYLGCQLLAVADRPLDEVVERFRPIVAWDNEMTIRSFLPRQLTVAEWYVGLGLHDRLDEIPLRLRWPDGSEENVALKTLVIGDPDDPQQFGPLKRRELKDGSIPLAEQNPETLLWFQPVAEGRVVYAAINGLGGSETETFPEFSARLHAYVDEHPEVQRLVLDFRRNSGGNTFLNRVLVQGLMKSRLNVPGGLVVLIGRTTFSAAQNTVTEIERHTQARFVGEPTGSSPNFIGETVIFQLPYSKQSVSISDLFWESSSPLDRRTWIAPQVYLPPRADDYFAGRDPALEAALDRSVSP